MAQFEKNSLQDILDKGRMRELTRDGIETIFPVYKPKDEIALNIFKALNARLIDLGNGKLGIPMPATVMILITVICILKKWLSITQNA